MADIERLRMPVEPGLEFGTVIGLQHQNAERKALSNLIQEADGRSLIASVVDPENAYTGAVVDGRELLEALTGPRDAL